LADAINKARIESTEEVNAKQRRMAEELAKAKQPFQNRINELFNAFERAQDFINYKTPELEKV
jgi:hypothetical protein